MMLPTTAVSVFSPNGYCNVPVADLVVAPITTLYKNSGQNTAQLYTNLPFDDADHGKSCRRIGQLLLHDPVEIIEYRDQEVCIVTPQWEYAAYPKSAMKYWTLKSNITQYNPATKAFLPTTLPLAATDKVIVALKKPWFDKRTGRSYSVGTRFVAVNDQPIKRSKQVVWCATSTDIHQLTLPSSHLIHEKQRSVKDVRRIFIDLLTAWSIAPTRHASAKHCIPYVLGGCSYTHHLHGSMPGKRFKIRGKKNAPMPGFDCSHLITRAAQLAGIPLYAANSTMLLKKLSTLSQGQILEAGDIIYFPGHVAIITDMKRGLITEARSATTNRWYGLVQTIPLSKQFQEIETIDDLIQAHHTKQKITRLDSNGNILQVIPKITLLKLC